MHKNNIVHALLVITIFFFVTLVIFINCRFAGEEDAFFGIDEGVIWRMLAIDTIILFELNYINVFNLTI